MISFTCQAGVYRFILTQFCLMNALATFQRPLDMILSQFKPKTLFCSLNNLMIHSNNIEQHFNHFKELKVCLDIVIINLKLNKCDFFTDSVNSLWHEICPRQLETDKAVTAALKDAIKPCNQNEVRSFLCLYNLYSRLVHIEFHVEATHIVKGPINETWAITCDQFQSFSLLVKTVSESLV